MFASSARVYRHFVDLNAGATLAAKWVFVVVQHGANLLEHAPRGFVRYSRFALDLLGGDSAAGRGHEVHRIEPRRERRGRLVEDGVRRGVNVIAAMLARIGRTALEAIMLCDFLAVLAVDAVGIQAVLEPL